MSLSSFHPITARWFSETFGRPTTAQERGWAAIRRRQHTLIAAPTGSGKTLAAFLTVLDDLVQDGLRAPLPDEVRVLYVSPLKALSADIHKNLAEPRRGIRRVAEAMALEPPRITAAVRTGDTTQSERAAMLRTPPHVLVTTPESLYLLLTAERSRAMLRTVRTVIVDEIHAVIGTRRGAHLALSLERLQHVAEAPVVRIGLSATQKPIEEVANFLVGSSPGRRPEISIIDHGHRRQLDIALEVPRSSLEAVMSHEVWEEYYDRLTELIGGHRTTLVFVNTRRMAERLARHLSDRLGESAVTAHHGSLSKDKRLDAESRLKAGQLRALVATASLELGIDIGSVDLVCQIGSPHRISTFLQRVGRSGHTIAGLPKGRLFPVSRDDLIECAALLRSVGRGELDAIVSYDTTLDVLAQQIVAIAAAAPDEKPVSVDDLHALVTRTHSYAELPRTLLENVLDMLDGRYPSSEFAELRPRIVWDRIKGTIRARPGARQLAVTNAGTIPDRGLYAVTLPDGRRVGELDEEMVFESRVGETFLLGASTWRIEEITHDRVLVTPAPGQPGVLPFWKGDAPGRPVELGKALGAFMREISSTEDSKAIQRLRDAGLDEFAAVNLVTYLGEQREATGALPDDRTIVVERFRDELGDWRLVVHTPFGARVHGPWAQAIETRVRERFGLDAQTMYTDDGIVVRLPDADEPPS
ncbi:MAG: DEAD/DEAH box helicase, partial [Acidobacteria bacterium]